MNQRLFILQAETPVAFREGRDQDSASTLSFLPGTSLRGALAAAHALLYPGRTEQFSRLFLSSAISFGNGYAANFMQPELKGDRLRVLPLPMTALSCKRSSGFRSDGSPDEMHHGVLDSLIPMLLFSLSEETNINLLRDQESCGFAEDGLRECQEAPERLSKWPGVYRRAETDAGVRYGISTLKRELRTHAGISRARGTAHEGILYSREMLHSSSRFSAELRGDENALDELAAVMDDLCDPDLGMFRAGTNRARGLGELSLAASQPDVPASTADDIAARIKQFNAKLEQKAKDTLALDARCYLPVTLESDVIKLDPLFRHQGRLDDVWLEKETGIAGAKLMYQAASLRHVTGWNALWGLPRSDDWAIERGSVFVFALPHEPGATALDHLARLESSGTGERQIEGFGRLHVASPFHVEVERL